MLIVHGRVFTGNEFRKDLRVRTENGTITETGEALTPLPGEETLDLGGDTLMPGFVDVHIHGFRGHDTMYGEESVRFMSRELRKLGVAAFCPTLMSASPEDTRETLRAVRAVMDRPEAEGAAIPGAHMEAPFLSGAKAGAQRAEFFRDPDWAYFTDVTEGRTETVRLITLAPERKGSAEFIRRAAAQGVHVSIGHTAAGAETVHAAAEAGADHVTHLFNAQTPLNHRAPGVPGAALTDRRLWCEVICDGIHLHADAVRLAVSAARGRVLAITDAMEAAGMPDGTYALGGQKVDVSGGRATLGDGTLAGSVLTMPAALHNLIAGFRLPEETACAMCTSVPAESIGEKLYGRIVPGAPAVMTRWTPDWERFSAL